MARRFPFFLVASLLFLPLVAEAADLGVTVGFAGQCRMGAWTPVTVGLRNTTGDGGSGTITTTNGMDEQMPYETPFTLPASSTKTYTHYIPFNQPLGELEVKLLATDGRLPFPSGVTVKSPVTMTQGGLFVVVAGPASASLNFLSSVPVHPGPATRGFPNGSTMFAARVDPQTLPDKPLGYDGVDLLVLSDFSPAGLDAKRLSAIKMWLAGGGTLLVNGGANFQQFQNDFYADLLPMDVTGVLQLADLDSLGNYHPRSQLRPGPVAVCGGKLRPGASVVLSQAGTPIIMTRQYGLGQVYFFAFDYSAFPVRGWDGQTDLMSIWPSESHMRRPSGAPSRAYSGNSGGYPFQNADTNPIEAKAGELPNVTTPSFELILGFMLAYLVFLVPVNYFILSRKKQRELAWITTPAIILIFTIGAYGMGYAMKGGKLLLKTITIVESGANARYGLATSYTCLFSPSRRTYDITVSDPYAVVSESHPSEEFNPSGRPKETRNARVLLDETTVLPDIAMDMWGMRTFRTESGTDLKGTVDADLTWDRGSARLTGTIINNTGYNLRDCTISVPNGSRQIGSLAHGARVNVDKAARAVPGVMPAPSAGAMPAPVFSKETGDLGEVERSVQMEILSRVRGVNEATLIGWSDASPSEIELRRGNGEIRTYNCFVFRLPLKRPGTGGQIGEVLP